MEAATKSKTLDRKDLYVVRNISNADRNFILATWLRGLYYGDSWFSQIPKNIFMDNYHKILESMIGNPNVTVKVACLKEDKDVILGYSISRKISLDPDLPLVSVLDWIFVKSAWRNIGIARNLLPEYVYAYTHLTKQGGAIAKDKLPGAVFNPFIFQ